MKSTVTLHRYWKVLLSILAFAGAALFAFSGPRTSAAQQPPASPNGRFQVFSSPASPQAVILLDTQNGRAWLMCSTKDDSAITARTVVTQNWCAMNFIGTAPRP